MAITDRMQPPIQAAEDPAVDAALGRNDPYARMQRQRAMSPAQKRKAARDARRSRVTYDLPGDVIVQLENIATANDCPPSSLVHLLILEGIRRIGSGEIVVSEYLEPSRALRWARRLDLEKYYHSVVSRNVEKHP